MGAVPESREDGRARISRGWLVLAIVFAGYLVFRLVQGVVWLVQHM